MIRVLTVATLLLPLACDPDGPIVLAGEHIDIVLDPGRAPCGDLAAHMDRYLELAADRWGVDLTDLRYTYHWQTTANYRATSRCPTRAWGCAYPDEVFSLIAPLDHELLHLVSFSVGRPHPFFIEGAAVAFELSADTRDQPLFATPVLDALADSGRLDPSYYGLAGAYTRLLIDRHGMPAYLGFYADLHGSADLPAIEAAHLAAFDEPLADTIAVFDAERRTCLPSRSNFKIFECSAPQLAWDGDVLLTRHDLACTGDEPIGPFADGRTRTFATFLVDRPGLFELSTAGDMYVGDIRLTSCGGCDAPPVIDHPAGDGPRRIELTPGTWSLQIFGTLTTTATTAVRLERLADR